MNSNRFVKRLNATWILLALSGSAAWAGPNAGGTLILHVNPSYDYCQDHGSYCGDSGLLACEDAVTSVNGNGPYIFFALAAFPASATPSVRGVAFGLTYDASSLAINAWGHCGDFELPGDAWPNPGRGTAVVWNATQSGHLVPVYWFLGYDYVSPTPTSISLAPHPDQGGYFADDSVPSILDAIAAYGALGFDQPGVLACPADGPARGACCGPYGACIYVTESICDAQGWDFGGDGTTCETVDCPDRRGACCFDDGECTWGPRQECEAAGGEYQGDDTYCSQDPCTPPPPSGACCLFNGICVVVTESNCATQSGQWLGAGAACDPNPCPPGGACCLASGGCRIFTLDWCETYFGVWFGEGTDCEGRDCATGARGACCLPNGSCVQNYADQCVAAGGLFQGDGTSCEPSPCPALGACCRASDCLPLYEQQCSEAGGEWLGPGTSCWPQYPCPGPAGACCLVDGHCVILLPPDCYAQQGEFLGPNTPCDPEYCGGNGEPTGSCCIGSECLILTAAECFGQGGTYNGDYTPCNPNPCLPVAVERRSWGGIKARYR
ncbi:MAG: hypothetical protein U0527_13680 [Candidatus Eisenbacteria bacterium]